MLGDLTALNTPKIIVRSGSAAEGTFGNGKNVVALRQDLMDRIIDHLDALFCQSAKCCTKAGKPIGNSDVVLNVGVTVWRE